MKISIFAVGRLKAGPEQSLYERYSDRIKATGKSVGVGPLNLLEISEAVGGGSDQRRASEAQKLLGLSKSCDRRIALDETGKSMTSRAFCHFLSAARDDGIQSLGFFIGGADGHGSELIKDCQMKLSLGSLTLPHGLARIVLTEQIYRAITIMSGHPYHRD